MRSIFDNGHARFKNRYVRTRGLEVERRAGRAVYGGFEHPVSVDASMLGVNVDPGPVKSGAFINVLCHAGRLLALGEASASYEMTPELDTIGEWNAGTANPLRLGAHNRRHPRTGALFALTYTALKPVVFFHHIDAFGNLVRTFPVNLVTPSMIHDFVLTERFIVLLLGPAVFDKRAAALGQPFLQWRPSLGTRIGVITLDGSSTVWLDAEPCFMFHFATASSVAAKSSSTMCGTRVSTSVTDRSRTGRLRSIVWSSIRRAARPAT